MATKHLKLSLVLTIISCITTITHAHRHGMRAKTLHVNMLSDAEKYGSGMKVVTMSDINGVWGADHHDRIRRSATDSPKQRVNPGSGYKPSPLSKMVPLNDSHYQMIIHWAGKNSDVIVAMTRDIRPSNKSSSNVYISRNYGATYENIDVALTSTVNASFDKFYNSPVYNSHYVFADTMNQYIFTTRDYGRTFHKVKINFKPKEISMHAKNADVILAYDEDDSRKRLYVSEDFGVSWRVMQSNVKSFFWGIDRWDHPNTLFVERKAYGNTSTVFRSSDFFKNSDTLMENVIDFEVKNNYMFVSSKGMQPVIVTPSSRSLELWVSRNRGPFEKATFHNRLKHQDYYIADASEDQVFLCVNHNKSQTHLYISDMAGLRYSLSLQDVVYFNPDGPNADSWLSYFAEDSFADIHKVGGLHGVYIASQLTNHSMSPAEQVSYITYNKGAMWQRLVPPAFDLDGKSSNCSLKEPLHCSLHLTQRFHQLFPRSRTTPILSKESAIGLIMGTGSVGKTITRDVNIYVSQDAGHVWKESRKGPHFYQFGDHGGIIVAVPERQLTKRIFYSHDEGESWDALEFNDKPIRIYGLLTEPGEHTSVFSLFGSKASKHSWIIIKIDLRSIFHKTCIDEDYKSWSPENKRNSNCLLGQKQVFERRRINSACFNGRDYVRKTSVQNCSCTPFDFECDVGFMKPHPWGLSCIRDPDSEVDPQQIPNPCPQGTYYPRSRGYRRIPGDTCVGGESYRFDPDLILCPVHSLQEFLLYTTRKSIHRVQLVDHKDMLLMDGLENVISIDYDYAQNCIYWADVTTQKLQRLCLNGHNGTELMLEEDMDSVEGLALDWMSNILFWVDAGNKRIELLKIAGCPLGEISCDRKVLIKNTTMFQGKPLLDRPRAIAVYPKQGYFFWTDWSLTNPRIMRAWMDGTNVKILISGHAQVFWPNGITVDDQHLRIYWTDAHLDVIRSADFSGKNIITLVQGQWVQHPYAISIYKNQIYWTDWTQRGILVANKYTGDGVHFYKSGISDIMDIKIMHHSSQQGKSPCSVAKGGCRSLCVERPGATKSPVPLNRTCLCSDFYTNISKMPNSNDEKCECEKTEHFVNDTCVYKANETTCQPQQFSCDNLHCIPMTWKCDHDNDCGDGSDETDCPYRTCRYDQKTCGNGHCIPARWWCDNDNDCGDHSDEPASCPVRTCNSEEYECPGGRCISLGSMCNGHIDCLDGSDEANCNSTYEACPEGSFHCNNSLTRNNTCVPLHWHCDGDDDCGDMSDELGCQTVTCPSNKFDCGAGECILLSWRCDLENDCVNGMDEEGCVRSTAIVNTTTTGSTHGACRSFQFSCANQNCVSWYERCDGVNDCGDGSDEFNCYMTSPYTTTMSNTDTIGTTTHGSCPRPSMFLCDNNHRCIDGAFVCNGKKDCGDNSDEAQQNCGHITPSSRLCQFEEFVCYQGSITQCINQNWVCDGERDCENGEDELRCGNFSHTCTPGSFRCVKSEGCIPQRWTCDGDADCVDKSDEQFCSSPSPVTPPLGRSCGSRLMFDCGDGECIIYKDVCNGNEQCWNGRDEANCTSAGNVYHISDARLLYEKTTNTSFTFAWHGVTPQPSNLTNLKVEIAAKTQEGSWYNKSINVENGSLTVDKLDPFTKYTVFIFIINKKAIYPDRIFNVQTLEGRPSAPTNLNIKDENGLILLWKRPRTTNGHITKYVVHYKDMTNSPYLTHFKEVHIGITNNLATFHTDLPLTEKHYHIWVTAWTTVVGEPSTVTDYFMTNETIMKTVKDLRVLTKDTTNSTIKIHWEKPIQDGIEVEWYHINYESSSIAQNYSAMVQTTTFIASRLSPGIKYEFTVYASNKHGEGPEEYITARTSGDPLPNVDLTFNSLEKRLLIFINITSAKNTNNMKVLMYYALHARDLQWNHIHTAALNKTAVSRMDFLNNMQACEIYLFRAQVLTPAGQFGPLNHIKSIGTSFDELAPPEDVRVYSANSPDGTGAMTVTWNNACPFQPKALSQKYIVVVDEAGDDSGLHMEFPTKTLPAVHGLTITISNLYRGAAYNVFVKAYIKGSRRSPIVRHIVAPYSAPEGFDARVPPKRSAALLLWLRPKDMNENQTIEYEVQHSIDISIINKEFSQYMKTNETSVFTPNLAPRKLHTFRVRAVTQHGFSNFSQPVSLYIEGDKSMAPAPVHVRGSSSKLMMVLSVTIPCVVIIVFLVLLLGIYIVRHQRLQRSFLSFANSHYDTRSGTTTFNTGEDLGEEDQPMIRGFSDDEPLVIA